MVSPPWGWRHPALGWVAPAAGCADDGPDVHVRRRSAPAGRTTPGARHGGPGTVEVALREIADETIVPDDLREEYIHAMQKHVEVDEPESSEVPLIQQSGDMVMVADEAAADLPEMEQMTEEELLRGLEGMPTPESPGSQRNGY